ncbi:MAG TPA: 50S ribosomal protein L4, partial [Candidatus Paceibacterota bacterium]|nr:50S ribosomal protein L4 [Candidatus Paceibacterota bacterium]
KKPWAQKGTGRARHGSSRSPIWVGGGVSHGPRNTTDFSKTITRQMRQKALLVTLSRKFKDNEVVFVDSLEMSEPKAKNAKVVLGALTKEFAGLSSKKNAALIALPTAHEATLKSFRNFGNINAIDVRNLNPVSVLSAKYLVIANPEAAFATLSAKKVVSAKGSKAAAKKPAKKASKSAAK